MVTVFSYNRHPAYQYLLSHANAEFLISNSWNVDTRPHPGNVTFIDSSEVRSALNEADIWLSHMIKPDLIRLLTHAMKLNSPGKIIQIMHGRIDRTHHIESKFTRPLYAWIKSMTPLGLRLLRKVMPLEYVYISPFVAESWDMAGRIIQPGSPTKEIDTGTKRTGPPLVVGNDLDRGHFDIDLIRELQASTDLEICGKNSEVESTYMSWDMLKSRYQNSICYLNLLQPPENAFNLATLEAMAGGCPILTLPHPRSPFIDGENALVCETVEEFNDAIRHIKSDQKLRTKLSQASRNLAVNEFSMSRFVDQWSRVLSCEGGQT